MANLFRQYYGKVVKDMKNGLVGKILTSVLVVLVGVHTLALPITHAKTPKTKMTVETQKPLDKLTAEELLPLD